MPWDIRENYRDCKGFAVVKRDDGEMEGCHVTREAAQRQMRALYAAEGRSGPLGDVELRAADSSAWDGNRALGQCSTAADYRSICAGERSTGEPDERQHWALPHHYLGRGPNAAGVRNALARLPQTQGLKNAGAARSHLERHMSEIRGGEERYASVEAVELRSSTISDVDVRQRLIDMIAVPWNQEADVISRGEVWREVFVRGAFDGIEAHAGRVRVNREHQYGDTVGKVVQFTNDDAGLLARAKIAETPRGDETLALAEEDMISASLGYRINRPSDVEINRRTRMRRVMRAFIDHLSMVEAPAYAGAQVLAVRAEPSGLQVEERPLLPTPALDEVMNDPVLAWARDRVRH